MAIPLEKTFQSKILSFLKNLPNTFAYKAQAVSIGGIPDIVICCRSLFIVSEVKRSEKHKPTPLQYYTLREIEKAGGIALVTTPSNWGKQSEALRLFANEETDVQNFIQRIAL